ncbi:hypothetical protein ACIGQE_15335 [Streptomyces sp. NPDC053429]|uniref:hypothetical protein n=1 Tax=Streptomyces sp. NPDC053429 TaxID=3365702 RepID=UPI0037CF6203
MESEAANLAVTSLGLDVRPSLRHPGGVCRTNTLSCTVCHGPTTLVRRYGTTMSHCAGCRYGVGLKHDPERCWEQI